MKYYLPFIILLVTTGCASNSSETNRDLNSSFESKSSANTTREALLLEDNRDQSGQSTLENEATLNSLLAQDSQSLDLGTESVVFSETEMVSLSLDNMPLDEFINHAFADILNVNFAIDPNLEKVTQKKVTLNLEEKVSKNKFYRVLLDTLASYEIGVVGKDDLFFIHKTTNRGNFDKLKIGIGKDLTDIPIDGELIYQIVPLEFADVNSVSALVPRITLASAERVGKGTHIALRGYKNDVIRALRVVQFLDVPAAIGKHVVFLKLKYIEPDEFIEKVNEILEVEGVNIDVSVKVTALPRQNGVVVHSSSDTLVDRVRYWKNQLDTSDAAGGLRYMLYFPENSKATDLADGLTKLLNLQSGQSATRANNSGSGQNARPNPTNRSSGSTNANASSNTSSSASQSAFAFKDLSMVADDLRNAIIFYTSPAKYQSLLPIIKQLDVLPAQVMVEAKFVEVTLTDKFSNGIEWAISNGLNTESVTPLSRFTNGSFAFNVSDLNYDLALNFLKQDDKVKVLSNPRILVTNGNSANINVGTEVPVLTTQSNDVDTDRVLQSVQYRSTGVDLSITPTVNSHGIVSLRIAQSVSETSENGTSDLNSPLILNRSINTEVVAKSGETVVLGGLIRENNSYGTKAIPGLGSLPLIGGLFSSRSDSLTRTELVVLITPRIVHNTSDLEELRSIFQEELTLF